MQLNKYDLIEWVAKNLKGVTCENCLIREECDKKEKFMFICFHEDEIKKILIKKYNL